MADEHKRSFFTKLHAFHRERGEDTDVSSLPEQHPNAFVWENQPPVCARADGPGLMWCSQQNVGHHGQHFSNLRRIGDVAAANVRETGRRSVQAVDRGPRGWWPRRGEVIIPQSNSVRGVSWP